jgi:hypothetical protein
MKPKTRQVYTITAWQYWFHMTWSDEELYQKLIIPTPFSPQDICSPKTNKIRRWI